MRKNLVLILCLSLIFTLVGCNSDKKADKSTQLSNEKQTVENGTKDINNSIKTTNEQSSADEKKETDSKAANSTQSAEISTSKQAVKDNDKVSQKIIKVNSKVKLYAGTYFDDGVYRNNESKKNYCEIVISNVTKTSFDFAVYQVKIGLSNTNSAKRDKKIIFLKNTAVFIGDGTKAAFYGKSYTLNFTFPNYHNAYPDVTDMKISGFEPLEGNTYVNNGIPGHEFG
jgi:hypothetical protein